MGREKLARLGKRQTCWKHNSEPYCSGSEELFTINAFPAEGVERTSREEKGKKRARGGDEKWKRFSR
jgi:hypothetical protein